MKNQISAFLLLFFCLFGCGASDDTEIAIAYLHDNTIDIFISDSRIEGDPPQVSVVVTFNVALPACHSYHETHYVWIRNTCIIKPEKLIYTGGDFCLGEYRIHRVAIVISQDLPRGVYEVKINNIRKEFEVKAKQTDK